MGTRDGDGVGAGPERERFEISLGERLVGEGTLTRTELARGRADAEAQGVPLAVALVRLGMAEGVELTRAGAAVAGHPPVPLAVLATSPETLCSAGEVTVLREAGLRPFARSADGLRVATAEPWRGEAFAEAEAETGLDLALHYADDASLAAAEGSPVATAPEPGTGVADAPAEPLPASEEDLMSESAFDAIYREQRTELPPAGLSAPLPSTARTAVIRELPPLSDRPRQPGEERRKQLDRRGTRSDRRSPGSGSGRVEAPEAPREAAAKAPPRRAREPEAVRPLEGIEEARRLLEVAGDRRQLGWVLARHALAHAERVVLLAPEGGDWCGWSGAGRDVSQERVLALRVPSTPGSIFGLVGATGGPFLGPIPEHPVHKRFFRALGLEPPGSAGLFPVHDRGTLCFALYLDGGAGGQLTPDLGAVLVLAQSLPTALARLEKRSA